MRFLKVNLVISDNLLYCGGCLLKQLFFKLRMESIQKIYDSLSRNVDPNLAKMGVVNGEKISAIILPFDDLSIENEMTIDFILADGVITIRVDDPALFNPEWIQNRNELVLPWIDYTKYSIAVLFYCVRNHFQKLDITPWDTPLIIYKDLHSPPYRLDCFTVISGAGRTRGKRPYMEDVDFAYDAVRITDRHNIGMYGVLDGHGGQECARFSADEIPVKVTAGIKAGKIPAKALFDAFLETDTDFLDGHRNSSGSTAVIILWDSTAACLHIANAGDTRAVLCRGGRAIDLTRDKKATSPEEIARIYRSGGFVVNGRVQGTLAVSRALGDLNLKANPNGGVKRFVIPDPEITTFQPNEADEFIVMASDGLWDVMSSQAVVEDIRCQIKYANIAMEYSGENIANKDEISSQLCRIADTMVMKASKTLGSTDNITVLIIFMARTEKDMSRREAIRSKPLRTAFSGFSDDHYGDNKLKNGKISQSAEVSSIFDSSSSSKGDNDWTSRITSSSNSNSMATVVESTYNNESSSYRSDIALEGKTSSALKTSSTEEDDMMDFLMDDSNF